MTAALSSGGPELGDRAGMATTSSQIGILLTETGRAAAAVAHNLSALSMSLQMRLPQARIDLHWLGRQRAELGEEHFWKLVRSHVDEQSVDHLQQLLNDHSE